MELLNNHRYRHRIEGWTIAQVYRKLTIYHNIFEIKYIRYLQKIVGDILRLYGIPPYLIRYYIYPYLITTPFPKFTMYQSYHLTDNSIMVNLRRLAKLGNISLDLHRNSRGYLVITIMIYDGELGKTTIQPLIVTNNILTVSQIINYCFCHFNQLDMLIDKTPPELRLVTMIQISSTKPCPTTQGLVGSE
jgi:hypothetical protein